MACYSWAAVPVTRTQDHSDSGAYPHLTCLLPVFCPRFCAAPCWDGGGELGFLFLLFGVSPLPLPRVSASLIQKDFD